MPGLNDIREIGLKALGTITMQDDKQHNNILHWKRLLFDYTINTDYKDDEFAWLSCIFALKAVYRGNFGVGSVIVNSIGELISFGHNEVFYPYFRSDRHAEMVVMNKFEEKYHNLSNFSGFTLYTSLESCPMCLVRLISSGIKRIYHIASDETGGMTNRMEESLPEDWLELAKGQDFGPAVCSTVLSNTAKEIFLSNANQLFEKLKSRRV